MIIRGNRQITTETRGRMPKIQFHRCATGVFFFFFFWQALIDCDQIVRECVQDSAGGNRVEEADRSIQYGTQHLIVASTL